ncbi:DUF4269 domain-containing protein [Paenibacillus puldeungensis]|uniref:DUF4269 domain-containing protein n=1 Tax=Paenibacillus puldeungensis TaxID=696536 RepID=A0ABW3S0N5_9BACL
MVFQIQFEEWNEEMPDFQEIAYLREGNERQKRAYCVMIELGILEALAPYYPVLAGTFPLDIDVPGSDLDIICEVYDSVAFERDVVQHYGKNPDFTCKRKMVSNVLQIVVNFSYKGFLFELFGQPVPVIEQNAYKHMVIEYRILQFAGPKAKQEIRKRKQQGRKTEPAFADWLGLDGDPYAALLEMAEWEDERLNNFLAKEGLHGEQQSNE